MSDTTTQMPRVPASGMPATPRQPQQPRPPWQDGAFVATAAGGLAMLAGLVLVLEHAGSAAVGITVAIVGVVAGAGVLIPRALAAVHRQPALLMVVLIGLAGAAWLALAALQRTSGVAGLLEGRTASDFVHMRFWPLALIVLAATGGVVLVSDAMRVRIGLAQRSSGWRQITENGAPARTPGFPWRALAGVALIGWAAFVAIGLFGFSLSSDRGLLLLVVLLAMAAIAVIAGTPLLIAALARDDQRDAAAAREADRRRFAAHLHDSVLQTLALVQRQAHDPHAVTRLARRQEHALRAWMAGEAELASETLVAALHDVVGEVEEERDVAIELSAIGDRPLDASGEALAAAAREALRNATHHGGGAPVFVFAEVTPDGAAVFVRDEGPGFVPDAVPTERRGVRDAIVGRMAAAGGSATIDTAPGEGTEVALRIGVTR
ncbi:sensor histidine kinase [Conexibacter woesei]|uniref:sensor histidine kinase n=1 Tax=Conexibacter woesei TaxID=191495 RepID=UPI0003FAA81F|nr:ATP-binding protein [Conexibacter woesei]